MKIWNTVEDVLADFEADRPKPNPPPKPPLKPTVKAQERWANQPTEAVIDAATRGNNALAERLETMEGRRQKQMAKELAEYNAEGSAWHNISVRMVEWQQSAERVEIVSLPYHRRSVTVGRDDSDHNLHVSPEDQLWGKMR
jgi:hypothetical protein